MPDIRQINPVVFAVLLVLWISSTFARLNVDLDFTFKIGYTIVAMLLSYIALAFESWRLDTQGLDWREKCRKEGYINQS